MTTSPATRLALAAACLALGACEYAYPSVSVRNGFAAGQQVTNVRFNGCVWTATLSAGQSTPLGDCLSGEARVYYSLFDPAHPDQKWLGHQTRAVYRAQDGERLEVTLGEDDDERDLTAPGPYGH